MSSDGAGHGGDGQIREVDSKNLLNYQTDSDDEDDIGGGSSDDDLGGNLDRQKEEL